MGNGVTDNFMEDKGKKRNILITGVAGFIGKTLVDCFAKEDSFKIFGVDITQNFVPLTLQKPLPNFKYDRIDLSNYEVVVKFINENKIDTIIHLAGYTGKTVSFSENERLFDINTRTTFVLSEAASVTGVFFIFFSTAMVYGEDGGGESVKFCEVMAKNPQNFYGLSKSIAEDIIEYFGKTSSLRAVILRLSVAYGPGQTGNMFIPSLVEALVNNKKYAMTKGEQTRDFIYSLDIASAVCKVVKQKIEGIYNLSSGVSVEIGEVANLAERIFEKNGLVQKGAVEYRQKEIWKYEVDNLIFSSTYNWKPTHTIEKGIKDIKKFMQGGGL